MAAIPTPDQLRAAAQALTPWMIDTLSAFVAAAGSAGGTNGPGLNALTVPKVTWIAA